MIKGEEGVKVHLDIGDDCGIVVGGVIAAATTSAAFICVSWVKGIKIHDELI